MHKDADERDALVRDRTLRQKDISRRLDLAVHHVGSTGRDVALLQY